jgi:acyl carrier protein
MKTESTTLEDVKAVIIASLGIGEYAKAMTASTPLLGNLPELDSLAVVQLVYALEDKFNIVINDDEVTADTFDTLGSLTAVVERKFSVTGSPERD